METINKFNTSAVSPHMQSWELINWKKIYAYVKKLRQRIFRAEQLGQKRKTRKLQRLMIKSKANLMLSIKRVTQINKGKQTAGMMVKRYLHQKIGLNYSIFLRSTILNILDRDQLREYISQRKTGKCDL